MAAKQQGFSQFNPSHFGERRAYRNLFLPRFLSGEANDERLRTNQQQKAYEILCKWAELETSGKLARRKETSLEGEFITEVFGQALGYALFSENAPSWDIEAKYQVNGGEADAAIGLFAPTARRPRVVIELKGPRVNLDRDRFNGRTAVQQCWDYLNALPECPWGIVSNYVSFRFYHRNKTPRIYEHFTLQELKQRRRFEQFYYLFSRNGLLPETAGQIPRADRLLEKTDNRQREVGDELYTRYDQERRSLIRELCKPEFDKSLDKAIYIAQRLLDRIIFIAFCEDRDLLPEKIIRQAWEHVTPFTRVTNPRWRNFLELFRSVDQGGGFGRISPFNGGLFRADPDVDELDLGDEWTDFFKAIGEYDFCAEVNVDVLGHIFERSINDLERIRETGGFPASVPEEKPRMAKSAERKRGGVYYTPPDFTEFIVHRTVGEVIRSRQDALAQEMKVRPDYELAEKPDKALARYWRACFDRLQQIKIVDPACGSGAFLIRAYDVLADAYLDIIDHLTFHDGDDVIDLIEDIPDIILRHNLHGVDLSEQAVEITQLALWIRSARRGRTLADLSHNIVVGNSLVEDAQVHPQALNWKQAFPEVFNREKPGFDVVIGNPPWERMKLQEREFFDVICPEIAAAVNAADRRKRIAALEKSDPDLYRRYQQALRDAESLLDYVRASGRYPLTGKGDINTYAVFAELARTLVAPDGRVGLLTPSGIATDHTTQAFFSELIGKQSLAGLYDFENKAPVFADVHRSFKFCVLLFGGADVRFDKIDFAFFAHRMEDLEDLGRHIELTPRDFQLLNPNTRTCPVFRCRRDADITRGVYNRVPILVDKTRKRGGNPWGIKFFTMFHQTNDAELFHTAEQLRQMKYKRAGAVWKKGKQVFLPLYEAKMVQMYDHRAAGVLINDQNWMRQGQTDSTTLVRHQNPEFTVEPRWWVIEKAVQQALEGNIRPTYIAFKDVTSPTNQRTMIAAFIPFVAVANSAPLMLFGEDIQNASAACLLANINSFAYDFIARQKVGGVHLNFFIVEQLPTFPPDFYRQKCPWMPRQRLETWISQRVLKLTCTADDMRPLAQAAGFKKGVHPWDPTERLDLMAQLDAAYFLLYGISRDDAAYILSTFSGAARDGETVFGPGSQNDRILKYYDEMKSSS
ncbi:MAG: N-6 DNA methylase [Sedimentisphaerales bacterium]|nr:N-6 DNA methylase [Sedimentisphaerales bacterium]